MKDKQRSYDLINHYDGIHNYRKMAVACLEALAEYPDEDDFKYCLAHAYYMDQTGLDNDYDKTLSLCNELQGTSIGEEKILALKGRIYKFKGDFKKARETFERLFEKAPNDASSLASYANVLYGLGERKLAEQAFEKASEIEPNNYHIVMRRYDVEHFYNENMETELTLINKYIALGGPLFDANVDFGNTYYKYGMLQEAFDYYVKALMIDPTHNHVNQVIEELKIEIELKNREDSENEDTDDLQALLKRAHKYYQECRYEEALQICLKLMDTNVRPVTLRLIGKIYNKLERYQEAKPLFEEYISTHLRQHEIMADYAETLFHMGEREKGREIIESVYTSNPSNGEVLKVTQMYAYIFWKDEKKEIELIDRISKIRGGKESDDEAGISNLYATTYIKYRKYKMATTYYAKNIVNNMINLFTNFFVPKN